MKYSLRSFMIVVLALPPLLAAAYFALESMPEKTTGMAFIAGVFVAAVIALSAVWIHLFNRL